MSNHHTPNFYNPRPQPFYASYNGLWHKADANNTPHYNWLPPLKLITWNIDFQTDCGPQRMQAALDYLQQLVASLPAKEHFIILLQEMTKEDLNIIQDAEWVREKFHATDLDASNWLDTYGTITLIDRRLKISSVFRVRYDSQYNRDALFVDMEDGTGNTLRVCNTHLESMGEGIRCRPNQVRLASRYLRDPTTDGAVIAGDFNAIDHMDEDLHALNGLKDAFLESGGSEGDPNGWTWGMQSPGTPFPPKRMDKILYCGKVDVENMLKIGAGLTVEVNGKPIFVTDHHGLMVDIIPET